MDYRSFQGKLMQVKYPEQFKVRFPFQDDHKLKEMEIVEVVEIKQTTQLHSYQGISTSYEKARSGSVTEDTVYLYEVTVIRPNDHTFFISRLSDTFPLQPLTNAAQILYGDRKATPQSE